MAISTFATIYVGTYEVTLKIFDFNQKRRLRQIDDISTRISIGRELFQNGAIGYEMVDELCLVLTEFKRIMSEYGVTDYSAFFTTAFRDASNVWFVTDQIRMRTGFEVRIISNSEHRLLSYKAVTSQGAFEKLIKNNTVVADIGGDSIQMTIFRGGELVSTQRLEMGTMRLYSLLNRPGITQSRYRNEVQEYINKNLDVYTALYLEEKVESLIVMSSSIYQVAKTIQGSGKEKEIIHREKIDSFIDGLQEKSLEEITAALNLSDERDPLIIPALLVFRSLLSHVDPKNVWIPGVDINDGIAYDFAHKHQLIKSPHNFDADILSASRHLAAYYRSFTPHVEALCGLATQIFDAMKKIHGLDARSRLLLQVAALLHDVGKYISLSEASRCALEIIRNSEIIGLTHEEREIVAWTVYYNSEELDDYEEMRDELSLESYLAIAKLSAILRVANALDQSHKQKFKSIRAAVKDRQLILTVEAFDTISLEQVLFESRTVYFEDVFSMKPVLKEKRVYNLEAKKKA